MRQSHLFLQWKFILHRKFLRLKGSKFCSDGKEGKEEKKAPKQLGVITVNSAEHSQLQHPQYRNPRISVHGINTSAVKTPKILH